jgi:hypothetical protein
LKSEGLSGFSAVRPGVSTAPHTLNNSAFPHLIHAVRLSSQQPFYQGSLYEGKKTA